MLEKNKWVKKTIKLLLLASHIGAHVVIIMMLATVFYATILAKQTTSAALSLATLITFIMLDTLTLLKRYDEKMYEKIYGSYK